MAFSIEELTSCRLCGYGALETVLNLGNQYVVDFVKEPNTTTRGQAPLELVICEKCNLVQLKHTVNQDALFKTFWYRSDCNEAMVQHLKELADTATEVADLGIGDRVLDIGTNTGVLLGWYPGMIFTVGVDPCKELIDEGLEKKRMSVGLPGFFSEDLVKDYGPFKVITAISMFYDVPDPIGFLNQCKNVMTSDGILIIQMNYLVEMMKNFAVDNICLPEHDLVITADGQKPIGKVQIGDEVLTHKGRYRKVEQTFRRPYRGKLIHLKAFGFTQELRCTPDHPIFARKKQGKKLSDWGWIKAADIRKGDVVGRPVLSETIDQHRMSPNSDKLKTLPVNNDFLSVCGWYLAEGSIGHAANSVTFYFGLSAVEKKLATRCQAALMNLGCSGNIYYNKTSTAVVSYGSIRWILEEQFLHGAGSKKLPRWVFELPEDKQRILFNAYMEGDGYLSKRNCLVGGSISRELIDGISMLANRLGYKGTGYLCTEGYWGEIESRKVLVQDYWAVSVMMEPKKKLKVWLEDGYQCGRVSSVKLEKFDGFVCNLEVSEDNTYVSPAMTVHNCHEHLAYYSMLAMKAAANRAGFEIVGAELNDVNGGSIRVYLTKPNSGLAGISSQRQLDRFTMAMNLLHVESKLGLDTKLSYEQFQKGMENRVTALRDYLIREAASGEKIYIYGASTRGTVTMQLLNLPEGVIQGAAERDSTKYGLRMVGGTWPKIYSEDYCRERATQFLVLPWHYGDGILDREEKFLKNGGKMIIPFPSPRVVTGSGKTEYLVVGEGVKTN